MIAAVLERENLKGLMLLCHCFLRRDSKPCTLENENITEVS